MTDDVTKPRDAEQVLSDTLDMREHLTALKTVDPSIAREIEATWTSTAGVLQRMAFRNTAASLIQAGRYDDIAKTIVEDAGNRQLRKILDGKGGTSDTVARAMKALGLKL